MPLQSDTDCELIHRNHRGNPAAGEGGMPQYPGGLGNAPAGICGARSPGPEAENQQTGQDDLFPHAPRTRAQNRSAEWQRELARAYAYQVRQASPEEAAELHAEYERRMSEGPDFARYRRGSSFAEAPLVRIDRNERVRLMTKFRAIARGSWKAKSPGRHRGAITRTAEAVFEALMYLASKYDRLFPSLEGLGHLAMCCKQSVVTAIEDLERLGFVTRHRRIRRVPTPLGFKVVQTTNAYEVHEPNRGLGWLAAVLFAGKATGSNYSSASGHVFFKKETADEETEPVFTPQVRLMPRVG
jgi:hypothetical protein